MWRCLLLLLVLAGCGHGRASDVTEADVHLRIEIQKLCVLTYYCH